MKASIKMFVLLCLVCMGMNACKKSENASPAASFQITNIQASPSTLRAGENVTLSVTVSNPESKNLTYRWKGFCGKELGGTAEVSYAPPECCAGMNKVKCTVSDGTASVTGEVEVNVTK